MPIRHVAHWYTQLPFTTLVGPIAGATIGYFVSKRRDRIERDTRQRTVAGALVAEVARIRTALGADARDHRAPDPIFYGLTFEPPRIHPWLEHVIIDAADISPNVVSDFMALERELGHFATLLGQWREAAALAAGATAVPTPARMAAIAAGGGGGGGSAARYGGAAAASAAVAAAAAAGVATEQHQRSSRERARALYEECVATQRMAGKVLDRLEATLTPVLASPAPRGAGSGARDAAAPEPRRPGGRWRRVKTRLRRAGATVLADFGLGDGWPEERAPASSHDE